MLLLFWGTQQIGDSVADSVIYNGSIPNVSGINGSIAGSVFYNAAVPGVSSSLNSIADQVIYDEGTQWGGGDLD